MVGTKNIQNKQEFFMKNTEADVAKFQFYIDR